MEKQKKLPPAKIRVENASILKPGDLDDLCDSTELAIIEGGGFGWINVPARKILENYWKGVIAIPERELIIGRLDNVVAGSCQIIKPSKNNKNPLKTDPNHHSGGARPPHDVFLPFFNGF